MIKGDGGGGVVMRGWRPIKGVSIGITKKMFKHRSLAQSFCFAVRCLLESARLHQSSLPVHLLEKRSNKQ